MAVLVALPAMGCLPDCDLESEVEAMLAEDTIDCGRWDYPEGDLPLDCANAAIAEGRDFRFDYEQDMGHTTVFSRDEGIFRAFRNDKPTWLGRLTVDTGVEVDRCEAPITEALAEFESDGFCRLGEERRNACPDNENWFDE